jgi:RimJ/RimL family protein N-acetyltransferase
MEITFRAITATDTRAIVAWRYDPPYDFYDLDPEDAEAFLAPEAASVIAEDGDGRLLGFASFGFSGRVPGGESAGVYDEPLVDVGLGMPPNLVGTGLGAAFCQAVLDYAEVCYRPAGFRLTVAAFNQRAIRVYERLGFEIGERFPSDVRGEPVEFMVMRRWNGRSRKPNPALET